MEDYVVVERECSAGGLARTVYDDGFLFDHAIHVLYPRDPSVRELVCTTLLKDNIRRQVRRSFCYTQGIFTEYPYQIHNFGLPKEVVAENLLGLIETKIPAAGAGTPRNFEDWIFRSFGRGIARHFMIPYNRKIWAWDLQDMDYRWVADRVPVPELEDVIRGALGPPQYTYGPNREFWYPERGGIAALARAFEQEIPADRLWLNADVAAIDNVRREVFLNDGRRLRYGRLISTIPLPALIRLLGDNVPGPVRKSAGGLLSNTVHTVNIGLEGEDLGPLGPVHWAYFPGRETIFHRASVPGNFSSGMVPHGCSSLQFEISGSEQRPCSHGDLIGRCLADLIRIGILSERDRKRVLTSGVIPLHPAYIIYDLNHGRNTRLVRDYLARSGIISAGRFGEWEYLNMDEAIMSGKKAAESAAGRSAPSCTG